MADFNPYEPPRATPQEAPPPDIDGSSATLRFKPERLWRAFLLGMLGMLVAVIGLNNALRELFQGNFGLVVDGVTMLPVWYDMALISANVVIHAWLFVASAGLLRMREWGRRHFIYNALVSLLVNLVSVAIVGVGLVTTGSDAEERSLYIGVIVFGVVFGVLLTALMVWPLTTESCRKRFALSERYRAVRGGR